MANKNLFRNILTDAGLNIEKFSFIYDISYKTVEAWYYGTRTPNNYTLDFMANTVYMKLIEAIPVYRVYAIDKADEYELHNTNSYRDAVSVAEFESTSPDHDKIEIRLYSFNPYIEGADLKKYKTVTF